MLPSEDNTAVVGRWPWYNYKIGIGLPRGIWPEQPNISPIPAGAERERGRKKRRKREREKREEKRERDREIRCLKTGVRGLHGRG